MLSVLITCLKNVKNKMNLSPEDSLRLNVLLKQEPQAVRIDESKMRVLALTSKGEASLSLNPNCRDDQYLKQVRELFSTHVLGSPGGYPVYIKRWTRMGQDRENSSLHSLLQLGEPEAVMAVVHAPSLTPELAKLAWWVMPEAENARCMLGSGQVVDSDIGRELAQFLIEYLPFETEPDAILKSVRLVLQPGLVSEEVHQDLWQRAARKGTIYISFLQAMPDALPEIAEPHPVYGELVSTVSPLLEKDNAAAKQLCRVLSPTGQAFLKTVIKAMDKLADEAAAVALFDVIGKYFGAVLPKGNADAIAAGRTSELAVTFAQTYMDELDRYHPELAEVQQLLPEHRPKLTAMVALSFASEALLDSFFSHSDAVGPLMRRKMKPWTEPLLEQVKLLQN